MRSVSASPSLAGARIVLLSLAVCFATASSCRKRSDDDGKAKLPPAVVAPELTSNQLASAPGSLLRHEAKSPIRWQTADPDTLRRASDARRPVFALIGSPEVPLTRVALEAVTQDEKLVATLNRDFVPVLVDVDCCREAALLSAPLCQELKKPTSLPLFCWLSPEGNPISWMPCPNTNPTAIAENVTHTMTTVARMWSEDYQYILNYSKSDDLERAKRLSYTRIIPAEKTSDDPPADISASIRQLAVLYDSTTQTFDGSGGIFPAGALSLLADASHNTTLAPFSREAATQTTTELAKELATSAMVDPLDGGTFTSRVGSSWDLPDFTRACTQQAKASIAWFAVARATHDPAYGKIALSTLQCAVDTYHTPDGLFALGSSLVPNPKDWLWTETAIRSALTPEEAKVFCATCHIQNVGNVPVECDPQRNLLRLNSLAVRTPPSELAKSLGLTPESADSLFQSACTKLQALRTNRFASTPRDSTPHAASSFRMVSAFAAAWSTTGDPAWREKGVDSLRKARAAFSVGNQLRFISAAPPAGINSARAFHYGLAIQAALDVFDITLDPSWLSWAEDLASTASELFTTSEGALVECPAASNFFGLPIGDRMMLFDESSAGLLSLAEARLTRAGRLVSPSLSAAVTPLPRSTVSEPILHTDLLGAALSRLNTPIVVVAPDAPADLQLAITRLPVRLITRALPAKSSPQPAPAQAAVLLPDGTQHPAPSAPALMEILAPFL